MTSFPLKMAMKWRGSFPMVTRTCTAAPPNCRPTSTAWYAEAASSSLEAWRPCRGERGVMGPCPPRPRPVARGSVRIQS